VNKPALDQMWDQFRQKYGVYLRAIEALPADRFHTHPVPGMRTPAELVTHISGTVVRDFAEGVAKGAITADESAEARLAAELGSKPALVAFARECFERANAAVARVGDTQLQAMVPTPWGSSWPGAVAFQILSEEFLHHRGQLYVFLRACGTEPPFIWAFAENEPAYQPRAVAEPAEA
jgi:uncharacterized damage-inducible protein DinB